MRMSYFYLRDTLVLIFFFFFFCIQKQELDVNPTNSSRSFAIVRMEHA